MNYKSAPTMLLATLAACLPALATLPPEYVEYTYLQGNGTDTRVVTDYMPTPNYDTIQAVVEWPSGAFDHNQTIWCARGDGKVKTWTLFALKDGNNGYKYRFDYGSSQSGYLTPALATGVKYTITAEGRILNSVGENGQRQSHSHGKTTDFTTGGPLVLFGSYTVATDNNLSNWGGQRLYSFTVTRGGTKIHDFVPAVRTSDNRSGVYDKVEGGRFYPGEGTFILGDPMFGVLDVSASVAGVGSPAPAYGKQAGLSAGDTRAVSCGAMVAMNAAGTAEYTCVGWKLYDDNGMELDHGAETSFTYTHPTPAAYRRLEWQWEANTFHRYVVPAGTAGNTPAEPYDSWATAANSVAAAFAAPALSGNPVMIHVAPGVYAVAEQMIPPRANVEIRSDDGSGHLARETTILDGGFRSAVDCDSTNRFFQISKNNFALRGFTLRNSCAAYEKQFGGGAVYISSGIKGVTLDSCTFTNCNAFFVVPKNNVQSNSGGAVSVHYDSANCGHLVTNCLFVDCRSPTGAAAINSGKSRSSWTSRETLFVISDCVFLRTNIEKDAADTTAYGTSQYTGAVSGPVWIENSRFTAVGKGATRATVLAGDYSVLTGCVFENLSNTLFNSSCIISNSVFRNNKASMVFQSRDLRICSSVITNNGAVGSNPYQNAMFIGGKVVNCLYAYNDHPVTATYGTVFENCTIVSNRNNGVAMTISTGGYSTFRNCLSYGNRYTAWGNSNTRGATSNGNFFYFKDWAGNSADYLAMGNCYFENGGDVTLNQYRGNGTSTSLLSLDPGERSAAITAAADAAKDKLFVDWPHHNWRLQRKSPLREAGVRYSWMNAPATDLDGNPRLTDAFGKAFASSALPDLGCYECQDRITRGTTVLMQ